ncbi:MAG: GtrA family protein [Rhodospirillaceae bacterium]|nr:GtrA family protein [Rhodospirillaceae bacterium]
MTIDWHTQARRFFTFAAVGLVGTGAHYATLTSLVELAGFTPVLGSVLGFLVGAITNYILNYRLTFHSAKRHREAASKFLGVAGSGFILNALLMTLLVNQMNIPYLLAQVAITGLLLFWHYALNAIWTFK